MYYSLEYFGQKGKNGNRSIVSERFRIGKFRYRHNESKSPKAGEGIGRKRIVKNMTKYRKHSSQFHENHFTALPTGAYCVRLYGN